MCSCSVDYFETPVQESRIRSRNMGKGKDNETQVSFLSHSIVCNMINDKWWKLEIIFGRTWAWNSARAKRRTDTKRACPHGQTQWRPAVWKWSSCSATVIAVPSPYDYHGMSIYIYIYIILYYNTSRTKLAWEIFSGAMVQDQQAFSTAKQWRRFPWNVHKGLTCHRVVTVCCYPNWVGQARRAAEDCFVAGRGVRVSLDFGCSWRCCKALTIQDDTRCRNMLQESPNFLAPGLPLGRCGIAHEAKQRVELRGLNIKTYVLVSLSTCPLPARTEQQTHSANKGGKVGFA